jgi:hypothetical protein
MRRPPRVIALFVIVIVLAVALVAAVGGAKNLFTYTCRTDAEALGLHWVWSPTRGCLVQQINGTWLPLVGNRHPQVP